MGKIVEACGLNGTFDRKEFPIISKLLPLAENVTFLKAVCKENGNDAVYSNINIAVEKGVTEVIGGSDKYNAVDRKTYYCDKDYFTYDLIREFIIIYANSKKIFIDTSKIDTDLKSFLQDIKIQNANIKDITINFLSKMSYVV
jgi:hypothetical protein